MKNNDIILSVYVATYNHEKYIERALDSILMQKIDYNMEILVGEDCSTDSTREILKEYEKNHPDSRMQIFYREKNMYGSECNNSQDLKLRCRGKYMIALEGDDFWTDENKLQRQVEFLETHPEYIAVAHNCVVVGEDSEPNGEVYQECEDTEYTFKHFFSEIMPGQLATLMYRNYFIDEKFDYSILEKGLSPDDRLMYCALLCHGKIYCIQEKMSAYRHITTHGSSFSATNSFNYERQKRWQNELTEYLRRHCGEREVKISEYQYLNCIMQAVKYKQLTLAQAFKEFCGIEHRFSALLIGVKRLINKKVFHKKLYT